MREWSIYPITYMGLDKKQWIREQLILRHRNNKKVSTFLDLRGGYRKKRDYQLDLEQCKNMPRYDRIVEFKEAEC